MYIYICDTCIYIYVIHVYIYIYMWYMYIYIYIYIMWYMYIYMWYMYIYIYMWYMYIYICDTCIYIYMWYMYIYMWYMYIYICDTCIYICDTCIYIYVIHVYIYMWYMYIYIIRIWLYVVIIADLLLHVICIPLLYMHNMKVVVGRLPFKILQIIQMTNPNTWPKHNRWPCRTRSYVRRVFSPTKRESLPAPNRVPSSGGFSSTSSTVRCHNNAKTSPGGFTYHICQKQRDNWNQIAPGDVVDVSLLKMMKKTSWVHKPCPNPPRHANVFGQNNQTRVFKHLLTCFFPMVCMPRCIYC